MGYLPNKLRFLLEPWAKGGVLLCASSMAIAQDAPGVLALDRQVDDAFRQVLKTPTNQETGLQYARLLVAVGNYEGGVAALERLLLNTDPPPTIRLELAVLYYRLGSYQMSEALLRQALNDTRLANEQRMMAQTLLRDVTTRNQPSQLSGVVMLGVRRQSNPSARSDAAQVYAAGHLTSLAEGFKPRSDTDIQLTTRLDHRYDLGWQNEAVLTSSLVGQITDYQSSSGRQLRPNQEDPYDLAWVELATGVRFKPAAIALPSLQVRPYLVLAGLAAQKHNYLNSRGLGLNADYQINEKTLASVTYEYRRHHYANRVDVPAAEQLSGSNNNLRLQLNREIAPGHLISLELGLRHHQTGRAYYDYNSQELRLTYATSYLSPLPSMTGAYWSSSLWAGVGKRNYDMANPDITAEVLRKDNDWRVGASLSIPISNNWSVVMQLEHVNVISNLPNYQSRNTSLMGAVAYNF